MATATPGDPMTKTKPCQALSELINTNLKSDRIGGARGVREERERKKEKETRGALARIEGIDGEGPRTKRFTPISKCSQ